MLDVFPGVYTPDDFLAELSPVLQRIRECGLDGAREAALERHRRLADEQIGAGAALNRAKSAVEGPMLRHVEPARLHVAKSEVEGPVQRAVQPADLHASSGWWKGRCCDPWNTLERPSRGR